MHWFPVEPSWILSVGLIVLAALPHQLPLPVSFGLRTGLGATCFALLSAGVMWKKPVLGMAMFILLAGTWMSNYIEGFAGKKEGFTANIIKDAVQNKHRWLSEEIMNEDPHGIQERTEYNMINDDVTEQDAQPWLVEDVLGETPMGIQERPVQPMQMQETTYSQPTRH